MSPFDIQRMLIDEFPLTFLLEVGFRATFAFVAVFLFLKSSGRRGIRQLSLFELVVILTLGSAAGDVSFYHDVPLLPVVMVFLTLLLLYRITVLIMTKSKKFESWIDGLPITVISEGLYEIDAFEKLNMSSNELLMELRQQGVEHLGQVRLGLVETDGDISLYFYDDDGLRPGLSVLPLEHRAEFKKMPVAALYCCVSCGFVQQIEKDLGAHCPRCDHDIWALALKTRRCR
ncbi:DUF421 domain-containing protein [Pseudomonas extremorientalis]|uniref:DUF421 domain-containing protein n=1 Tax=Pseudomonas extremorientalis TaxID=169669 RepID=UPI00273258BE|nr:YetF domain-containing protein [Pseudomonas extremorientalis]WLG59625.1 DUF421 domain-containing protein [Pseudomonas extremorientalis]